jgi:hypothetical protein
MTQAQMERELARATGESLSTIRSRGFSIIEPPELEPLIVDWDLLDAKRVAVFPSRNRDRRMAA